MNKSEIKSIPIINRSPEFVDESGDGALVSDELSFRLVIVD